MNLNKGCIEIQLFDFHGVLLYRMNLNKGCIEISYQIPIKTSFMMNLNKGCIEIVLIPRFPMLTNQDEP